MQEQKAELIQSLIDILNPLIGFKYCEAMKEIIFKIIHFLCKNFCFSLEATNEIRGFFVELFQISTYSDYLLLVGNEEIENSKILEYGQKYFDYLYKKENRTNIFFKKTFFSKLDRRVIQGEPSSIRLKIYIILSNEFASVSTASAIILLKKLVLFGDFFSLKVLKNMDEKNVNEIVQIESCIQDMLFELKSEEELNLKYSKNIIENTKIIFVAMRQQMNNNIINHKIFDYLNTTNDSFDKKIQKIKKENFELFKRKKVGY